MTTKTSYNEDSIQHHKGLSGVRHRPGMYLGERGDHMVFTLIKELVDNSFDEFLAKRNSAIEVVADPKTNTYIVADAAEGIPVGLHKKAGISTLTLIFTELHAGGKFNNSAYTASSGTHGVGSSAVNAVCSKFEVWTYRDKAWHHQTFSEGKPLFAVKKSAPPSTVTSKLKTCGKKGTIIRIQPDQTIVSVNKGKTKAVLPLNATAQRLKNLAFLNRNLKITFTAGTKTATYLNDEGIVKVVKSRVAKQELEPMGKPLVFENDQLQFALQWTSYTEDDGMQSFVSCSPTRDGGSHQDEFFEALNKAIAVYKTARDKYTPRDIRSGLIGCLNWNMSGPEFSSQVKDRLTSNLGKSLFTIALKELTTLFAANKTLARRIIKRASEAKKAKEEFKKVMDGISKVNAAKRGIILPNILATARRCKPSERELFLVEGESAAGCFVGETEVRLADGSTATFKDLATMGTDFQGKGFNRDSKETLTVLLEEPRITKYVDELVEVELSDGTCVRCTGDHLFLLATGEYKSAASLTEGDVLQADSSEP